MAISAELRQRITEEYPAFAWLLDVPQVGDLLATASTEGYDITKLQAKLYATRWWKTTTETSRQWGTLVETDPASAKRLQQKTRFSMVSEAQRLGLRLTNAEYLWLSTVANQQGWTPEEITRQLVKTGGRRKAGAGQVSADASEIVALSRAYGLASSGGWAKNMALQIAQGTQTMEGITDHFRDTAAAKFAKAGNEQIKRGLDRGLTVREIMEPSLNLFADELGIDVNAFELHKGRGLKIMNYRDPETKEMRVMNDAEIVQYARQQQEWRDSDNAKSLVSQASGAIAAKMGARAG